MVNNDEGLRDQCGTSCMLTNGPKGVRIDDPESSKRYKWVATSGHVCTAKIRISWLNNLKFLPEETLEV